MKRRSVRIAAGAALLVGLWVVGLALSRSRLESPGSSHLLLDREGRFLGEVAAPEAMREVEASGSTARNGLASYLRKIL